MDPVAPAELLVLHGIRLEGYADVGAIAVRFGLDREVALELLLDYEACGWVTRSRFADLDGWSLTAAGRAENERRLAVERDAAGAGCAVAAGHEAFVALNARLLAAATRWQLRPAPGDRLASNDHTDLDWDATVLDELHHLNDALRPVVDQLATALPRFGGYADRFAAALARVDAGDDAWVAAPRVDSCHTIWMQLHEDLIATLGLQRGS